MRINYIKLYHPQQKVMQTKKYYWAVTPLIFVGWVRYVFVDYMIWLNLFCTFYVLRETGQTKMSSYVQEMMLDWKKGPVWSIGHMIRQKIGF